MDMIGILTTVEKKRRRVVQFPEVLQQRKNANIISLCPSLVLLPTTVMKLDPNTCYLFSSLLSLSLNPLQIKIKEKNKNKSSYLYRQQPTTPLYVQ